ncbi:hypothetical protein [Aridibaculum aurantiacum]|uniref:hypothetical protein n=1 Tax=Aridibaculum aurantiacum TaxID=2810307 RepID=UPI001A9627BC|nr:hypothetical protein [Aridibaculum aurantiacum]
MSQDVFKILSDLQYKAVGLDPKTKKMQEGYFVSFRNVGLPIPEADFANPWTPQGAEMKKILADAKTASTPPDKGSTPDGSGEVTPPAEIDVNQVITAGIAQSQVNYLNTYFLTNDKLAMSPEYTVMPSAGHVEDAWFAIINGATAIPPKTQVNDSMKKALADAQAKLMDKDGNVTPKYSNYNTYRDAYYDKVKDQNRAYADAFSDPAALRNWPIAGKIYQDEVNKAWNEWQSFGNKNEIETAINLLASQGQDPAVLLINRAKQKWENSLIQFEKIGSIPYTFMLPRKWYSANENGGWMTYNKTDFQSQAHASSSQSAWGASGGFSLGFFSIGATASGSQARTNMNLKTSGLEISFSYCTADIKRPWLDTNLLNLGNWFLMGDYKKNCISDGTYGQELKSASDKSTFLPSIVTSIILIKNLKIKWSEMNSQRSTLEKALKGGGAVGYGPFMVGGSYSSNNKKRDFSYRFTSEGLVCDGVQLLGYVSVINPASPRLDSKEYMKDVKPAKGTTSGVNPVR